jgi:hypothetical protein
VERELFADSQFLIHSIAIRPKELPLQAWITGKFGYPFGGHLSPRRIFGQDYSRLPCCVCVCVCVCLYSWRLSVLLAFPYPYLWQARHLISNHRIAFQRFGDQVGGHGARMDRGRAGSTRGQQTHARPDTRTHMHANMHHHINMLFGGR